MLVTPCCRCIPSGRRRALKTSKVQSIYSFHSSKGSANSTRNWQLTDIQIMVIGNGGPDSYHLEYRGGFPTRHTMCNVKWNFFLLWNRLSYKDIFWCSTEWNSFVWLNIWIQERKKETNGALEVFGRKRTPRIVWSRVHAAWISYLCFFTKHTQPSDWDWYYYTKAPQSSQQSS